ncbi:MAG: PAS domain S-box protein [Dehalococcoidales bacterium]|nr:PAS domain S-box protein [Dehalococcoidales bacterium]
MNKKKPTYEELEKRLSKAEGYLSKFQQTVKNVTRNDNDVPGEDNIDLAQAYLASEQNFKNSMDTSPFGVRIVTEDGALIYANKAVLDIFGYKTVEELAAVKRSELYTPESYAACQERKKKRKLKEYVPWKYELSIRRSDGEVRNLMVFRREVMWGGEKQYMAMYEDITEQKRAEAALKESEEKYHNLVEHGNDGIVYIEENLIQYCNFKMLEISGYSMEELIGKPFLDFIVPEQKQNAAEIYRQRIAGMKVPERYDLDIISRDGTTIHTEVSASLIYFRQKMVDIVILRDITDRKRMYEALRQTEEMFSKAFRSSPDAAMIVTFDDGIILDANDAVVKNTGYSLNELIDHSTLELNLWVNPEDRVKIQKLLEKNKRISQEAYKFRTKSGEIRTWEYSAEAIVIGGKKCLLSVQRDITEQKQAEDALKESEREKAAILNGVLELVTYQDRELKLIWANRAASESVGTSPEKLVGRYCYEIWQNRNEPCIGCPLVKCFATGQPHQGEMNSPDGRIWSVRGYPVRDENGSVIGATEITLEITERKQAEEALKESQKMFSLAFRDSPNLMVITSLKEGRFIEVNDAYCRAMGYSRDELIGHTALELNLWHDPEQRKAMVESLKKRRAVSNAEARFRAKSGEIRTFSLSMAKINLKEEPCLISIASDITERNQAEEALEESETRFRTLFETMAQGVVYQEADGKIISANSAAERILGLSIDQILGRTSVDPRWKSIHEDGTDFPGEEHPSMAALRTGKAVGNVVMGIFNPKINEHRWILVDAIPEFREGESTPYRVYTTFMDITKQKKAEKALQESEERYRLIFEYSKDAVLLTSPDGGILAANPEACRMFGRNEEEICRIGRSGVIDESDPRLEKAIEERRTTGEFSGELIGIRADGTKFSIELSSKVFYDKEGKAKTSMIIRDVSERKQAEEAIVESEERFRQIFQEGPLGIVLSSLDYRFTMVNDQYCKMFGYSEQEMLSMTFKDISFPEDAQIDQQNLEKLKKGELPYYHREKRYINKNGDIIWGDIKVTILRDKSGNPLGFLAMVADITERKRMEEQLERDSEEIKLIIDSAPIQIFYKDLEGKFLRVNKTMATTLNMVEEDLLGKTVFDLFSKDIAQSMTNADREVFTTGHPKLNIMEQHESAAGMRWVQTDKIPILDNDGKAIGLVGFAQDITEQKVAEEARKSIEERVSSIFSAAPIGIALLVDRVFTEVNDSFCEMVGYNRDELLGQSSRMVYPSDEEFERVGKKYRGLSPSETGSVETVFMHKDSTILNVILSTAPLDPDDHSKGVTVTVLDITERKRSEEVIKESEERFNKAFHASPNLMAVLTTDEGRFIDANAEHTRITGYERREIIGKTTLELNLWVYPEQRKEFYRIVNTEGRLKDYEILMRTKSGEIKTLLFSAEQITLRGNKCIVVSALDITERKAAEERINHLNLTLRSVRNVSKLITREKDRSLLIQKVCDSLVGSHSFNSTWIVLLDENQQPIIWAGANTNKEFATLIELMKQGQMPQCVNKALKQKQVVITEDPATECNGCPALCGNADTGSMTIRLEIEGGIYGVLCASISNKLIQDSEEISLFSEIATDIAFALRDIELVAANELQEQERLRMAKMETIGMLAGGIAHDFNNLLTGIMGNIGLVKTYISSSEPTYEMLDEAEAAAVRARDLTQQLLTFAKGGKPLKKLVNAAELIKESAEFALRGSKVKLELSLPDDLWQMEVDEGQISQVINNLVINADEAMTGGGMLKISAENQAVKKSDSLPLQRGNYIRVDISDTGMGMSPEQLQRVFEPYFTTKQRGSGLGLTTAYSVVKNHNGAILVESTQNKGSTFHMYLPATKKALKGAKELTFEGSRQAGGKVLIMDDEEIIRKMLKNMLGMAGYIVEVSGDGVEALEKYQQAKKARDPFNAVIMDLTIPGGMGGKEAVKKLLEIDPEATVIVSSGYATDPIMSDYKKYGFRAVIAKPYSVKQLRDLLSRLLSRKRK